MDKMFFLRHYGILLSAKSVLIDTDVAELTYQAYRNDFTNEEFAAVCMTVLKNENFYGEYNRTYLPAKSESDMNAIYYQMEYLLQLANEIR